MKHKKYYYLTTFYALFFLDFYLTLLVKSQYELNPIIRSLLSYNPVYFLLFKVFLAIVVLIGFLILHKQREKWINNALLFGIVIYFFIALQNIWVYIRIS